MPKATKDKPMLTPKMSHSEAYALVKAKKVPQEAFEEWLADKEKTAASNGATDGKEPEISCAEFLDKAKPLTVECEGQTFVLDPKKSQNSGSWGWGYQGKLTFKVGGKPIKVQAGINFTVANSAKWAKAHAAKSEG